MLFKLTKNLLPLFRDAYKVNWPKYNYQFNLFNHFIDRIEKFPEWDNKVHFYTTHDESHDGERIPEDATFVFIDGFFIHFDSLTGNRKKIHSILRQLNYDDERTFVIIKDEYREMVHQIIKEKVLKKIYDSRLKLFYLNPTDYSLQEKLLAGLPDEFYLDDLKESDANIIFQKYESRYVCSEKMIKKCIKFNPSTGLYRKSDNRLIGFTLYLECAMTGNLHIDEEFRRQKLGTYIVLAQLLKGQKANKVKNGCVIHENIASRQLLSTLRVQWIDNRSTIIVKKSENFNLQGKL